MMNKQKNILLMVTASCINYRECRIPGKPNSIMFVAGKYETVSKSNIHINDDMLLLFELYISCKSYLRSDGGAGGGKKGGIIVGRRGKGGGGFALLVDPALLVACDGSVGGNLGNMGGLICGKIFGGTEINQTAYSNTKKCITKQ